MASSTSADAASYKDLVVRLALLGVLMAASTGCTSALPGTPAPNPDAMKQIVTCRLATDSAVDAARTLLRDIDVDPHLQAAGITGAERSVASLKNLRAACGQDFPWAWSDLIVRTAHSFAPTTIVGRIGHAAFLKHICTSGSVQRELLSEQAQLVCSGR